MSFENEGGRPDLGRRHLTDAQAMRALAHPTRIKLLDLLGRHELLTATEASHLMDESPTNCAFHLRVLGKHGFVEEAGGAAGRRRPWRRTHLGFSYTEAQETEEASLAAAKLSEVLSEVWLTRARTALARRSLVPQQWQEVTGAFQHALYVTEAEMAQLNRDLEQVFARFTYRRLDPASRPEDSRTVEILLFSHLRDPELAE